MTSLSQKQGIIKQKISGSIFFMIFTILIFLPVSFASAQNKTSPKGVAIFGIPGQNTSDIALTLEAADYIKRVFIECGRFMPVERELDTAYRQTKKDSGKEEKDIYGRTAKLLNLDLYVLVSAYQLGNIIYSDIDVVPLSQEYKNMEKRFRLRSRIKLNIPLKAGREIALLHNDLPVSANIIKAYGSGLYLIDTGEWHGIKNNGIYKLPEGDIEIIQAGRFDSIVKIPAKKNGNDRIIIKIFPDTKKIITRLNDDISRNIINRYGLDVQGSPEKRLLEGICIINMGGNLCIPGYGAFLSTSYLGFKDPKPDWPGVVISTSAIAVQFLLPELLTGFKINFFPWEQDPDKTDRMQDLQKFLWLTIPITFSTAYMDQLAFQFTSTEHLPPFFYDKDNIAAVFSLFLPGGGLFYKGHRLAGRAFYFSEMLAAGYGVYNFDRRSGKYALYALGGIKLFDIIYAFTVSPSYSFYNLEKEREIKPSSFNLGLNKGPGGYRVLNLMFTSIF